MREYYIIRHSSNSENKESKLDEKHQEHKKEEKHSDSKEEKEFWDDPNYKKYYEKHGPHFCDTLAMWASKKLINRNGDKNHTWSVEEVKSAYSKMGLLKPNGITWGDVTYATNLAYASFFGESLKSELDVIKHANIEISGSGDYYGKTFNRWLSDVMGMNTDVPWVDFVY